jgi:hypothetical protein
MIIIIIIIIIIITTGGTKVQDKPYSRHGSVAQLKA